MSGESGQIFVSAMDSAWKYYKELIDRGVAKEDARYVLPNACLTSLVMTMNCSELRHFISLRSDNHAMPEMRDVATRIRNICKTVVPEVFIDM
jgi:thymidylate synthase (FAD)